MDNSYFDGETIDKFKFKNNYDLAERYAEEQVKDSSLKASEEFNGKNGFRYKAILRKYTTD